MAGLSLVARTDTAPCPRVEVTVDGLHATVASTVTVWRSAGGQRLKVRGADGVTATAAFFVVDYEAPLGRRVDYTVDVAGPTIPATTAGTVSLDVDEAWLQDPLAPTNASPVTKVPGVGPALARGAVAELSYPMASEVVQVLGSPYPVVLGGTRQAAQRIPLDLLCATAEATSLLRGILTTAFPVLVRPLPHWPGLPPLCFLAVGDMTEAPLDGLLGGSLTSWRLTGDLVAAPGVSVVVPVWSYQDVAVLWSTYGTVKGGSYLDWLKDPEP